MGAAKEHTIGLNRGHDQGCEISLVQQCDLNATKVKEPIRFFLKFLYAKVHNFKRTSSI